MEPTTNETPIAPDETTDTTDVTGQESVSLRGLLARAGRVYDLTIAAALDEAEMDDLPMRGVSVLRRIDEGGAPTPLAHVLRGGRISRQHGTQLIDTLVERGYIVRETDPQDRRRMRVSLTERGQAAADAVRTAVEGLNATLAEKITPDQMEAAQAVLTALIELAPARPGEDFPAGPDRGFFPGGRGHGPGHGRNRGFGRGPRGPMRDFAPSGDWRDRMRAFAASAKENGRGFGRDDDRFGGERRDRPSGRHGHSRNDRRRSRDGGEASMIHIDTVIVNAAQAPQGRRHCRHGHHGRGGEGRPFGPARSENASPETSQPDASATE